MPSSPYRINPPVVNRRAKIKRWVRKHQDTIMFVGVAVTVVTSVAIVVRASVKAQTREIETTNAWVDELNSTLDNEPWRLGLDDVERSEHVQS